MCFSIFDIPQGWAKIGIYLQFQKYFYIFKGPTGMLNYQILVEDNTKTNSIKVTLHIFRDFIK